MNLKEYQLQSSQTDQNPDVTWHPERGTNEFNKHEVLPILGLVSKVGTLLSEYKNYVRNNEINSDFSNQVSESLGDILWYVSNIATKFKLDLSSIAEANIVKSKSRWQRLQRSRPLYDGTFNKNQQLPRKFSYKFTHQVVDGLEEALIVDCNAGVPIGDSLTDSTYEHDGYRYHDAIHLAFLAHFGWSPVIRRLMYEQKPSQISKRTPLIVEDSEDAGRAQDIEEGIVVAAHAYAEKRKFLEGVEVIDWTLLKYIKEVTAKLEVKHRTAKEWNDALLDGFRVFRKLREHKGGIVSGDLTSGTLSFSPLE